MYLCPLLFFPPRSVLFAAERQKRGTNSPPPPLSKKEAQIDAQKHQLTTVIVSKPSLMPEHQLSLSHLLRNQILPCPLNRIKAALLFQCSEEHAVWCVVFSRPLFQMLYIPTI